MFLDWNTQTYKTVEITVLFCPYYGTDIAESASSGHTIKEES
jgi:hypothetical protein